MADKNKFQLNKGAGHTFDMSKGGKRKFDLSKDDEESVAAPNPAPAAPVAPATQGTATVSGAADSTDKSNNKWLWLILAIIAVVLLVWWLYPGNDSDSQSAEDVTTEVVVPTDSLNEEAAEEPALPADENVSADDAANDENASIATTDAATEPVETPAQAVAVADNNVSDDVEAEALKVIRGEYGIGQERKNRLGDRYGAIQNRVNQLKQEGVF
ncbi:MAG: hypothetical protein K2I56_04660 [Muribaculaceae bacterium]|nr:hypothetical protein [Muribaculaceae bacterium]